MNWTRADDELRGRPERAARLGEAWSPARGELGFDVTVDRDGLRKDGKLLRNDVFKSHYIPDSPTTVYGPGPHAAGAVLRAAVDSV